jgi:hypothetical protein
MNDGYTVITAYRDGTPHDIVVVDSASKARCLVNEGSKWENTAWSGCPELDYVKFGDFADDAVSNWSSVKTWTPCK